MTENKIVTTTTNRQEAVGCIRKQCVIVELNYIGNLEEDDETPYRIAHSVHAALRKFAEHEEYFCLKVTPNRAYTGEMVK